MPRMPDLQGLISSQDLAYLRGLGRAVILSATSYRTMKPLGYPVITPGGNYPSFWIRDFSMAAGCGEIPSSILKRHLFLTAEHQSGAERQVFGERAEIPPFSIPDHVNLENGAVFYPGTYSSGNDQGGEPFGYLPPIDNQYEFIHLAYLLLKQTGRADFLREDVQGLRLLARLRLAFDVPSSGPDELVTTTSAKRAVGFGFCDTVYLTGKLLFPTLLRYRALGELAELCQAASELDVPDWAGMRRQIKTNLVPSFFANGWLKAATDVGQQPDVWGTLYGLYLKVVPDEDRAVLLRTVREAVLRGTIACEGGVRHVPTDHNFSSTSAWEQTAGVPLNRYQNGAYWHVPSGWLAAALWECDRPAAKWLVEEMLHHFRLNDFRKGRGAPWECFHPAGGYHQNPIYMASVTLPLEALQT